MSNPSPTLAPIDAHIKSLLSVNLQGSQYDLETYAGRCQHFWNSTNPLNLLLPSSELEHAKKIITAHKRGTLQDEFSEKELNSLNKTKLWSIKNIYNSAYHPETGELQPWWGRMSSQVPVNMVITGAMVALSHTAFLNFFWQLANQSYNSAVNYTNRSGGSSDMKNIALSWSIASGGALSASHFAQKYINGNAKLQTMNPAVLRALAPFAGIVLANLVNIPVMRNQEILEGITVSNDEGVPLGKSTALTSDALSKVVAGRLVIAACCVILPSQMMKYVGKIGPVKRALAHPKYGRITDVNLTILCVGACLAGSVPPALAIWPQKVKLAVDDLPAELRDDIKTKHPETEFVYYNKGL